MFNTVGYGTIVQTMDIEREFFRDNTRDRYYYHLTGGLLAKIACQRYLPTDLGGDTGFGSNIQSLCLILLNI